MPGPNDNDQDKIAEDLTAADQEDQNTTDGNAGAQDAISEEWDKIEAEKAALRSLTESLLEAKKAIDDDMRALKVARERFSKSMDVYNSPNGPNLTLDEIHDGKPVEVISERDFYNWKEEGAEEAFMNEKVLINVQKSGEEGSLPVVVITVNGTNQPIVRGKNQWVKRKYIEAMARSVITSYRQEVKDPTKPDVIEMVDNTAVTYPFRVIEDPNPNGLAWLRSIEEQQR